MLVNGGLVGYSFIGGLGYLKILGLGSLDKKPLAMHLGPWVWQLVLTIPSPLLVTLLLWVNPTMLGAAMFLNFFNMTCNILAW